MATTVFHQERSVSSERSTSLPFAFSSTTACAALLALLFLVITLPPATLRPFHSKGEPREALVAQSMLTTGDWILPRRYQDQIATKPPMTHWIMATIGSLEGKVTEFSARAPSLILSLLTVLSVFFFLNSRTSRFHALLSSSLLMTSALWYRSSITSRVDMPLAGFLTLALLLMFVWEEREFKGKRVLIGIIGCLACGTLTKGPVALVIPALVWMMYLYSRARTLSQIIRTGFQIFFPALCISSLWYLLAYWKGGSEFLQIVLSENVSRMTGTMNGGEDPHQHSVFFLLGTLLVGTLPWSFLLFFFPWSRGVHFERFSELRTSVLRGLSPVYLFSLIVCISVFGFYCIPSSKKAEYLLPLYPFLSVLFVGAIFHFRDISGRFLNRFSVFLLALAAIVLLVLSIILLIPNGMLSQLPLPEKLFFQKSLPEILTQIRWLIPFTIVGTLYLGQHFYRHFHLKQDISLSHAFTSYLAVLLLIGTFIAPPVATHLSANKFAAELKKLIPNDSKVYSKEYLYGLDFYLGGEIEKFEAEGLTESPSYVLVSKKELSKFEKDLPQNRHVEVVATAKNDIRKPGGLIQLIKVY